MMYDIIGCNDYINGDDDDGYGNDGGIIDSRRCLMLKDTFFRHKHDENSDDVDDDK